MDDDLKLYVVICNTPDCVNDGVPIEVLALTDSNDEPLVFCGGCVDENGFNRRITIVQPIEE